MKKNIISYIITLTVFLNSFNLFAGNSIQTAKDLGNAFSQVAEKVIPSVVVITNLSVKNNQVAYRNIPPEFRFFFGIPNDQFHQNVKKKQSKKPIPMGSGSGFIIDKRGYILTNYHVVKKADFLEVKLNDGRIFNNYKDKNSVKIIDVDEDSDLAVIKIGNPKLADLPAVKFADSDKVRVGEWAIAVGAPFKLDYSVTVGVVSQKGRYDVNMNRLENYIQTDASINPGNSGGPLLNIDAEVIGVNDFIYTGGGPGGSVGIGFAIASNMAKRIGMDIIKTGKVHRPWLGISMQGWTEDLKKKFNVKNGVLIGEVIEGDPAEKAGLQPGDVIIRVAKTHVKTPHDVQFAVLAFSPGDKIPVEVIRNAKKKIFWVTSREKGGKVAQTITNSADIINKLGMKLTEENGKVVVANIIPDSPAYEKRIALGSIIIEVNWKKVNTIADITNAIKSSKDDTALFYISKNNRKNYVTLSLK